MRLWLAQRSGEQHDGIDALGTLFHNLGQRHHHGLLPVLGKLLASDCNSSIVPLCLGIDLLAGKDGLDR